VVECTGLENRNTRKRIVGSNPTLSASKCSPLGHGGQNLCLRSIKLPEILKYLKQHGERLDSDISKATGLSLEKVRSGVQALTATGEIIMCKLTRFEEGKPVEGWLCRVSGYIPPAAPGRKAKARV
jgi:hypothetical protein